jgi:glycosyltransferase involved in cell wall biosynthesis
VSDAVVSVDRALRVAVVWDTRTQWLGGWNYFLNMVRVTSAFAPSLRFILFSSPDLGQTLALQARSAGAETALTLPPFRRFTHPRILIGGRHAMLARALRDARIDVVFEMTNYLGPLPVPAISWIADAQHRLLPQLFSSRERLQRDLEFRRRLTRSHVMLSSQAARRDILDFLPSAQAQLHVVPFAVRATLAINDTVIAAAQARYGLKPGYLYLPNQLWQHKNHVLALEALSSAVKDGADIRLAMSGQALDSRNGSYPHKLAKLMDDSTLASHVRMLGVIPYSDLLALIAGSRALLNPSLFEGWSTTVEEAKALGAQMVLSDLPVHREQAEGKAIFFDRHSVSDCARALRQAMTLPVAPNAARRAQAAAENLEDQRAYAEKLEAVFRAGING